MNELARNAVNISLKSLFPDGVTSLYFSDHYGCKEFSTNIFEGNSLKDSIMDCLRYALSYCSTNEDNEFETSDDRNRSVIDIWRHLKYYNSELTIFEVMNAVYELCNDDELSTAICPDIGRRVFNLSYGDNYINDAYDYDVFPIYFTSWKDI